MVQHLSLKLFPLPALTHDNYDEWDRCCKHAFYAANWYGMYTAASQDGNARDHDASENDRRQAWGLIFRSLQGSSTGMTAKCDDVIPGEIEQLLRTIRSCFYRSTISTTSSLRELLLNARLANHADIDAYISHISTLCKRLGGLGKAIDDEDKMFYLLRGLGPDYDPIATVIKIPRDNPMAWEQALFLLRDYASNPRVSGTTARKPATDSAMVATSPPTTQRARREQSNEMCRKFLKGRCRRGRECRYTHSEPKGSSRPRCSYCTRTGHTDADCWKN